jgi:hypothetical protein
VQFPFGKSVVLSRRNDDGSFADAVVIPGCGVAARTQNESPVPSFPPLSSGREVYAPVGTVVAARDRMVVDGTSFEVDGDPEVWDNPFTGVQFGVRIYLRRADNWFNSTVTVETYLGSSGLGAAFAAPVEWPANVAAVSALIESGTGEAFDSQVQIRVPPSHGGTDALAVFTAGSRITVAGATSVVSSVQPLTRDGFVEFVEVTGR